MQIQETIIDGHKCIEYIGSSVYIIEAVITDSFADEVIQNIEKMKLGDTMEDSEEEYGTRILECKYKHLFKSKDEDIPLDYKIYTVMSKILTIFGKLNKFISIISI
jgi:hypothetical protein